MKVLMLTAYFPPEVGSAAHLFADLGCEFVRRGHVVTVMTGYPSYNVKPEDLPEHYRSGRYMEEEYGGIRVMRYRTLGLPRGNLYLRGTDQVASAVLSALVFLLKSADRPDIILVYSPPLFLGLAGMIVRWFRRGMVVINVQDLFPQSVIDLGLIRRPVLIKTLRAIESFIYRHADGMTAHSRGNAEYVVRHGANAARTIVAPNVVDTTEIQPGERDNPFRRRYEIPSDEFVVSFAGVLGYSQDLDTVIEAARLLLHDTRIKFYIVGDGVEKPRLLSLARGLANVRFLPMLQKKEYVELLHASDVCLSTLRASVRTPVVPSKILSIMAAGRPVVTAMALDGDAPALVRETQCGLCVEPENPDQLREAICRLAGDPALSASLGANGRRYAVDHLSLDVCVSLYENLFTSLTNIQKD